MQNCMYETEKIGLHRLVTPYQNRKLPIYRWYNYNHSFSRDLVWYLIDTLGLDKRHRILDPFCGTGTTLLAAKERGIRAIGVDILPLSVFVSNAKLQKYDMERITVSLSRLKKYLSRKHFENKCEASNCETVDRFFDRKILDYIFVTKDWINNFLIGKEKSFFLTALLAVLGKVSFGRNDGGFLRIIADRQIPKFKDVFFAKINEMVGDLNENRHNDRAKAKAKLGDARKLPFENNSFDAVITSPPYLNRHDYTRVYQLELAVAFMNSKKEIKQLRYKTLRSHVEARPMLTSPEYKELPELKKILKKLGKISLPNRKIIPMVKGYFEDMHLVLKELVRVVKPKGKISLVIGDSRYGGIFIPVGDIILKMGNRMGLKTKCIVRARFRGNSPQQMHRFGKRPSVVNPRACETLCCLKLVDRSILLGILRRRRVCHEKELQR